MGGVDISQGPRLTLVALAAVALVLLALTVWLGVRLGRSWERPMRLIQAALFGLALGLFTLSIAGQRHYGGSDLRAGHTNCAVWFDEAGLPAGRPGLPGDAGLSCRHDAIAAVGPALVIALGVALVGTALMLSIHWILLGRKPRRRSAPTRYIDA